MSTVILPSLLNFSVKKTEKTGFYRLPDDRFDGAGNTLLVQGRIPGTIQKIQFHAVQNGEVFQFVSGAVQPPERLHFPDVSQPFQIESGDIEPDHFLAGGGICQQIQKPESIIRRHILPGHGEKLQQDRIFRLFCQDLFSRIQGQPVIFPIPLE